MEAKLRGTCPDRKLLDAEKEVAWGQGTGGMEPVIALPEISKVRIDVSSPISRGS